MKKTIFMFVMLLSTTCMTAKVKHALEVRRIPNWAPEYLTVVNNWENLYFTPSPSTLKCLSVITEINGQSTADMEPQDFYAILDRETNITLTYMTKIRGENKTFTQQLKKRKGQLEAYFTDYLYLYKKYTYTTLMSDNDYDLFQYNTYDFLLDGDDDITDKGIMQEYAKRLEERGLKRDNSNPDLLLYLSKNANKSIETVYVPKIVTSTSSHSTTRSSGSTVYGWYSAWGSGRTVTDGTTTTTTRDVGGRRNIVNGHLFLQFSVLIAKNMDQKHPPIAWQFTFDTHVSNDVNLLEYSKKSLADQILYYPFVDGHFHKWLASTGLFFAVNENGGIISNEVLDVAPGSNADKNGIMIGDKVLKHKLDRKYVNVEKVIKRAGSVRLGNYQYGYGLYFNNKKLSGNDDIPVWVHHEGNWD